MVKRPDFVEKFIKRNYTPRKRKTTRGAIFHVDGGGARSLFGWFSNPDARASSNLFITYSGVAELYVPLDEIAWTSGKASATTIGIETQGLADGTWTERQLQTSTVIAAWLAHKFKFPLRLMRTSAASELGLGYHALGVPATRSQLRRGVSQTGGQLWSKSVGKVCPGPQRIPQMAEILGGALELKGDARPVLVAPSTPDALRLDGHFGPLTIKGLQTVLARWHFYRGLIDGDFGPLSVKALQTFLTREKFYRGLIDGYAGPMTVKALQSYLKAVRVYSGLIDGYWGPMTTRGLQKWINYQLRRIRAEKAKKMKGR